MHNTTKNFSQHRAFSFTPENLKRAEEVLAKYPKDKKRSAVMPLLYLVQEQHDNWISIDAMDYIATMLEIPSMYVYEVAHFYTMYNKEPVGKYLFQVCRTTPCWLRGSDEILASCKKHLGIGVGQTSEDGKFSIVEVECLGACINAPIVQINNDYYEHLTPETTIELIESLKVKK